MTYEEILAGERRALSAYASLYDMIVDAERILWKDQVAVVAYNQDVIPPIPTGHCIVNDVQWGKNGVMAEVTWLTKGRLGWRSWIQTKFLLPGGISVVEALALLAGDDDSVSAEEAAKPGDSRHPR